MDEQLNWHQLFGLYWEDFFRGTPVTVEQEKDLSLKQQLLDIVLIRKKLVRFRIGCPTVFEELAAHNLISFKSHQEALDGWVLNELVGHYVNYRKQVSPTMRDLLPEEDFRLFAVSVRYPRKLAQQVTLQRRQEGVYEVSHFSGTIRLVVVHQLPQEEHNVPFLLFSAETELATYALQRFRPKSPETSTLLYQLYHRYQMEGIPMPITLAELHRRTLEQLLKELPPEKLLERLSAEQRLQGLSPEKRLEGLSPEKRLEGLSQEELRAVLEAAQRRLQGNGPAQKDDKAEE